MRYPQHRLMCVTWLDSQLHPRWTGAPTTQEDLDQLTVIEAQSVGWIILDTAREIALAQSMADDGEYSMVTSIPKAAITEIRDLTLVEAELAIPAKTKRFYDYQKAMGR